MDHSGFTEIAQLISLVIELKETFGEGWMKVFEALMGALLLLGLLPKKKPYVCNLLNNMIFYT